MKTIGSGKHAIWRVAACVAASIALAAACLALANCSARSTSPDSAVSASERSAAVRSSEPGDASSEASEGPDSAESDSAAAQEQQSEQLSVPTGNTTSQDAVSGAYESDPQTYSPEAEAPPTTAPAASGGESQKQPVWVVDYDDVWVEDSPEWDESVPIYGYTEISVCNICGADVTGNAAAHAKQHMLAGEGSGHHSETRETVTGYETVHHPAEGHWERVESGGRRE